MDGFSFSITESAINKLLNAGFECPEVRTALMNTTQIDVANAQVEIRWEACRAPQASFADLSDDINALDEDGNKITVDNEMFVISAGARLTASGWDPSEITVNVIAKAMLVENAVSFKAVGLELLKEYRAFDRAIMKGICTQLLTEINVVLGFSEGKTPQIFNLDYLREIGIRLGATGITKINGLFAIWGSDTPGVIPVQVQAPPEGKDVAFFLTPVAYADFLMTNFNKHKGECHTTKHLEAGSKAAGAIMDAHIAVKDIQINSFDNGVWRMGLSPDMNLDGDIYFLWLKIGELGYDYSFNPDPIKARVDFSAQNNVVSVRLSDFESFTVLLTPTGSAIAKIDSGILWILAESITNFVTGCIPYVLDIPFSFGIPNIPVSVPGLYSLRIDLTNLSTLYWGGLEVACGDIAVSAVL